MQLSPPTLQSLCPCSHASHLAWLAVVLPLVLYRLSFSSRHRPPSGGTSTCPPLVTPPHLILPLFFSGVVASCLPWLFVVSPLVMHPPAPPPIITPQPLITSLSCHLSGWLSHRLSSCRCLPSAGASNSCHLVSSCCAPLVPLVHSGWLLCSLSS